MTCNDKHLDVHRPEGTTSKEGSPDRPISTYSQMADPPHAPSPPSAAIRFAALSSRVKHQSYPKLVVSRPAKLPCTWSAAPNHGDRAALVLKRDDKLLAPDCALVVACIKDFRFHHRLRHVPMAVVGQTRAHKSTSPKL